MYRSSNMRPQLVITLACGAWLAGCGSEQALNQVPSPFSDAGATIDAGLPPDEDRFREDFGNLAHVESSSTAIVDVNHGWVTLPVETFPALAGLDARTITQPLAHNGLIDARSLLVPVGVQLDATDSIELRAVETVHMSGRIRAGSGGVRIVAGKAVYIDGVIESAGPVRIQLAGSGDLIDIAGRIQTLDSEGQRSGHITLEGRGGVHVSGTLQTGSARYGDSGGVTIRAYGDVLVGEAAARITVGTGRGGRGGAVEIVTEGRASITAGTIAAGDAEVIGVGPAVEAGGVSIRAADVALSQGAELHGGRSTNGPGGGVTVVASRFLVAVRGTRVMGGAGSVGGTLSFKSGTATVSAQLLAGAGDAVAGRVEVSTAGFIHLAPEALLVGGDSGCGTGGQARVWSGGTLFVGPRDVAVYGGRGGTAVGNDCLGDYQGGGAEIRAQSVVGDAEAIVYGGAGMRVGTSTVVVDPRFAVPPTPVGAARVGWVMSTPFAREPRLIGQAPSLVGLYAEIPYFRTTTVSIALADADVLPLEWHFLTVEDPRSGLPLAGATRLRYRVGLEGRIFDAPVVEGFEIALGGR